MLKDMFEIEFSYLKSRFKRIINHIEKLKKNKNKELNVKKLKSEINKLDQNYLEPEFELKPNSFSKIIDENLTGSEAYAHLFKDDCFNDKL